MAFDLRNSGGMWYVTKHKWWGLLEGSVDMKCHVNNTESGYVIFYIPVFVCILGFRVEKNFVCWLLAEGFKALIVMDIARLP